VATQKNKKKKKNVRTFQRGDQIQNLWMRVLAKSNPDRTILATKLCAVYAAENFPGWSTGPQLCEPMYLSILSHKNVKTRGPQVVHFIGLTVLTIIGR
jgi:hypothetical protein